MATSAREDILAALVSKIQTAYPGVPLKRGFTGPHVDVFPSIYLFEDVETYDFDSRRRELYRKTLPVQVEFFQKCSKPEDLYGEANQVLTTLLAAVDTDETFGNLCVNFRVYDPEIAIMRESTYDVIIRLSFEYVELRMGTK